MSTWSRARAAALSYFSSMFPCAKAEKSQLDERRIRKNSSELNE
jgi:hypothetical protein